jgi:hypothetical protein
VGKRVLAAPSSPSESRCESPYRHACSAMSRWRPGRAPHPADASRSG